ncbi:hypothetical protein ACHAWO_013702 [Cyclotella atomus]|uniref:Uncharacterized protein n=1 Tax=Cyclotella atomus TaxID=382360 RepID=A0ABD3P9V1_9STRA
MMMEPINDSFFVSVTTSAASEPDTISPFPSVDDESLISSNSIETEPEESAIEEEDDDDDTSSSSSSDDDDDYDDDSTSSDESSAPPLPEDIGYVIDANGVSLLANLNRKLLEHRYGKDYKFDKVPITTKIDVDDAVDTMAKMEALLKTGQLSKEEFELMAVIPKSPSDVGNTTNANGNGAKDKKDMEKMMENLTKDDLQVLYKAIMGKEMPVESVDSREESESRRGAESRDDENPLNVPLPSILEESLSGSTTTSASEDRIKKKKTVKKSSGTVNKKSPVEEETVEVNKSKRGSFGFLKKMNIFKKKGKSKKKKNDVVASDDTSSKKEMTTVTTKNATISYRASSPFHAPSIKSFRSRVSEERDGPEEERNPPSPEESNELDKASTERSVTPIVAAIVDMNDESARGAACAEPREVVGDETPIDGVVDNKASSDIRNAPEPTAEAVDCNMCSIMAPGTKEDGIKEAAEEEPIVHETKETAGVEEKISEQANEEEGSVQPTTDCGNHTYLDLVSLVCNVNANGAEVEVLDGDDAIELEAVHIIPKAPISPTVSEYSHALADQGEKSFGRRFGKALRGKKSKSISSPSEELESEDIKLTPENPVIEIPLSEIKPRKSLVKKYHDKKPKFNGVNSPKAVETPLSESKPVDNRSEVTIEPSTKMSSGASVSFKKSTKSSKSKRSKKSVKKTTNPEKESPEKTSRSVTKSSGDDMHVVRQNNSIESEGKDFGSLRGYQDSEMESFEEAGALMFCGVGNSAPRNDWLTNVEKTFTQMFDYWDHTPAEAYENTKVYEENSRDDESVNSRFSKIHRSRSQSRGDKSVSSKGERSARSPSNRSVKSWGDKSTRSKSRTGKSIGDKSRSRSKGNSDKSVGDKSTKSARPRSKSVKSAKSAAKAGEKSSAKPTTAKPTNATPEKKEKKSGSQPTSGKSTTKAANSTSKKITAEKTVPVKKAVAKMTKPSVATKSTTTSPPTKADTKPKPSTAKKAAKKTAKENA